MTWYKADGKPGKFNGLIDQYLTGYFHSIKNIIRNPISCSSCLAFAAVHNDGLFPKNRIGINLFPKNPASGYS